MADFNEDLLNAASRDDVDGINRALAGGADINAYDVRGYNALHRAALNNKADAVNSLLDNGIDINSVDGTNRANTALHLAARKGAVQVVAELLKKDGSLCNDIDISLCNNKNNNAMHYAAKSGQADIILMLLEVGADTNMPVFTGGGFTALHFAAQGGHVDAITSLLSDEDIVPSMLTHDGKSALHVAAENGKGSAIETLVEHQPNGLWEQLNNADTNGNTALHLAAMCPGDAGISAFQALLKQPGIHTEAVNRQGCTPVGVLALGFRRDRMEGLVARSAQQGLGHW